MIRSVRSIIKAAIRSVVRARLAALPLSSDTADWYASKIRQWPAILGHLNYQTQRPLPAGMTMNLGIIDVIERTLLTTGQWDPIVELTLRACLKPGNTFLDVGANIGYFSLLASRLVGDSGRVVSFEPSARALTKLTAHLCLNKCSNVTVCSQALGETAGSNCLNWALSSNIGGSTIARGTASHGYSEQIAIRRLDDVCEEMQLTPACIKLDVEGFELFALRGAREILEKHHPVVVCELTNQFLTDHGQSGTDILRFMRERGYQAWQLRLDASGRLQAILCDQDQAPQDQTEFLFATDASSFRDN